MPIALKPRSAAASSVAAPMTPSPTTAKSAALGGLEPATPVARPTPPMPLIARARLSRTGGSAPTMDRSKILAGDASSTIRPLSMKITRSETSRANVISWVTISIVIAVSEASCADDPEHFADQLGVERRGDLVEEHDPRPHRQGPRDRHPLLLPAGELARVGVRLVRESDEREQLQPALPAPPRAPARAPGSGPP